ncbi:uncharacterized [Tachysurus ichikawai]
MASLFFTTLGASAAHHHCESGDDLSDSALRKVDKSVLLSALVVTADCQGDRRRPCLLAQGVLSSSSPTDFYLHTAVPSWLQDDPAGNKRQNRMI